ncbi:MAG: CoA transferase [Alphaproteobacteria bacterium]|nr:MAG: CoA transferase [Alphaproteobacteria bacterium]
MTGPLDGVRVIDLSNMLMAPYTTQIMGDMGADVIKVEAPGGDPVRGVGPGRHDDMGHIFLNCNRSKRSILLDLKQPEGHAALLKLVKTADVFIYNRRPQVMARLNLSYEMLSEINPRLIYAGLFGFSQNGPYAAKPAFDDLIQGAIGIPALAQEAAGGGEPVYSPTTIVDRGVGLWAVGQINAALYRQAKTGRGQRIDMPMFEMMASFVLGDHMAGRTFDPPVGPMGYKRIINAHRRPYKTKDSYVCVMVYTDKHWRAFFRLLGKEVEMDKDPRYASMSTRTANIADIYAELAEVLKDRTTAEWLALFEEGDIPAMPMHTMESLLEDPHLEAINFFSFIDHPSEGRIRDMAVPSHWSETQPERSRMAPRLGEHSAEILAEIGYSPEKIAVMMASGASEEPKT